MKLISVLYGFYTIYTPKPCICAKPCICDVVENFFSSLR